MNLAFGFIMSRTTLKIEDRTLFASDIEPTSKLGRDLTLFLCLVLVDPAFNRTGLKRVGGAFVLRSAPAAV